MEEKFATLNNQQNYTLDILLKSWMLSPLSDSYKDMTTIILFGSLISYLIVEVELSFSLMKLVCAQLRNKLLTENFRHCMRICKFKGLRPDEYEILRSQIEADDTKSNKKERFHHEYNGKFLHSYILKFFWLFLFSLKFIFEEKKLPVLITCNALHGVYNFFPSSPPINPFLGIIEGLDFQKFSQPLSLHHGEDF